MARRIEENLAAVNDRMSRAATRSGRAPGDVRLVAVTKYVDIATTRLLCAVGCRDLGESRPQQLWNKAAALDDAGVRWHMIGSLQRNKIARLLPRASLIHAGDSLRLLQAIQEAAQSGGHPPVPLLLEVNVSGDAAKHGFAPDEIEPLLPQLAALTSLRIRGLMAMSGLDSDAQATRAEFAKLRQLRDRLASVAPPGLSLDELSMGMSGDFEIAIEEGATIIRVGSALFEGVL